MRAASITQSTRQWLGFGIALALLNIGLSFHNVWPTLWITVRPEISMEIAALVLLLGVYQRVLGAPSDRMIAVLAAFLLVMVIGRYMEVTAPALFGRRINLYWDAQYIPDVAAMLARSTPLWLIIATCIAVPALLGAVFWLLYWALGQIRDVLGRPRPARVAAVSMAAVLALYFLGYFGALPTLRWFSIPLHRTYAQQIAFVSIAINDASAIEGMPAGSPLDAIDPGLLPNGDFIVTFVESYGAVAYDDSAVAAVLETPRQGLAAAVQSTNRRVVSAFVDAPTFGGASWLSHASFMTGLGITSNAAHNMLLTQSRPTLARLLAGEGYRAVALMPGLKSNWPEGAFYGFDAIYGAESLGYKGPEFGWWRIPDQYSLARVDDLELSRRDRAPVFLFFPTISTHMPFRPTPPYQPDWQRIVSAEPYTVADLGDSLRVLPEYTNLGPAYAGVLAYTYAYWSGYLTEHAERDFLLLLLGDHQPPANVSGEGARWHVPVHVITRDIDLVDRLTEKGFAPGLVPPPTAIAAMHELPLLLLER